MKRTKNPLNGTFGKASRWSRSRLSRLSRSRMPLKRLTRKLPMSKINSSARSRPRPISLQRKSSSKSFDSEAYNIKNAKYESFITGEDEDLSGEDSVVFKITEKVRGNDIDIILVASKEDIKKNIDDSSSHVYLCGKIGDTSENATIQDQKIVSRPFIKINIVGYLDLSQYKETYNGLYLDIDTAKLIISNSKFIYNIEVLSTYTINVELYNKIIKATPPPKNLRHTTLMDLKITGPDFPGLCNSNSKLQILSKQRMTFIDQ